MHTIGLLELRRIRCHESVDDSDTICRCFRRVLVCSNRLSIVHTLGMDSELSLAFSYLDHGYAVAVVLFSLSLCVCVCVCVVVNR
jgi:hypothetical protein